MDPISAALAGIGTLGSIFGGIQNQNNIQWGQNALVNVLNKLEEQSKWNKDWFSWSKDDLYNRLMPFQGQLADAFGQYNNDYRALSGAFNDPNSQYNPFNFFSGDPSFRNEGTDFAQNEMYGRAQYGINPLADLAAQSFAGGGWSPQAGYLFDSYQGFNAPGSANQNMGNLAQQVIAGGGANPYSNFLTDAGASAINRGGQTAGTGMLGSFGAGTLQSGGMTPFDQLYLQAAQQGLATGGWDPVSESLAGQGLGLVNSQGQTGDTSALVGRGLGIIQDNPLLSMEDISAMAGDSAGRQYGQAAQEFARRNALRGSDRGVRSGLQNEAMADFEDQLLQNVAQNITQARLGQQGQQLQFFGQGADLAQSGLGIENQRLGLGANLADTGADNALQRFGAYTGLGSDASGRALNRLSLGQNALGQAEQLANQNMQTLGGLGMQGLNAANDKLGMGINLFGQTQGNALNALQGYGSTLGNANQYALGMGNLARGGYNDAAQIFNQGFNNQMQQAQFGLNRQQAAFNPFLQQLQFQGGMANTGAQNYMNSLNPMQQLMMGGFNNANQNFSNMSGLFGSPSGGGVSYGGAR